MKRWHKLVGMKWWHTFVGWLLAQIGARVVKRKVAQKKQAITENKTKVGAAGVIALVLVGGLVATRLAGNGDD
jgi:hypothetical protein